MKRTVNAHIGGVVFTIEEEAYDALSNYLKEVEGIFGNDENAKEIVFDIEVRIAEIFTKEAKSVITLPDAEKVIKILGEPRSFNEGSSENGSAENTGNFSSDTYDTKNRNRKVFRNGDDRLIGGVASGLSAYFGVDPLVLRILFLVLIPITGTAIIIAYLILWAVVPEAKTPSEKLMMFGKPVNLENLKNKVNEEADKVQQSFKNFGRKKKISKFLKSVGFFVESFVKGLLAFFTKVAKFIAGVIASIIGLAAFAVFIVMLVIIFYNTDFIGEGVPYLEEFRLIMPAYFKVLTISVLLTALVPLLWIVVALFAWIVKFKLSLKWFMIGSFALWIISLLFIFTVGLGHLSNFKDSKVIAESHIFHDINPTSDTLRVVMPESKWWESSRQKTIVINDKKYQIFEDKFKVGSPSVSIKKATNSAFSIQIKRSATGSNFSKAEENAQEIEYAFKREMPVLSLNPFFTFPTNVGYRRQSVEIEIYIPEGSYIELDKAVKKQAGKTLLNDFKLLEDSPTAVFRMSPQGLAGF
ncbi:MAG: PspC domain-containing protein [Luteibaculaceae bacterium]